MTHPGRGSPSPHPPAFPGTLVGTLELSTSAASSDPLQDNNDSLGQLCLYSIDPLFVLILNFIFNLASRRKEFPICFVSFPFIRHKSWAQTKWQPIANISLASKHFLFSFLSHRSLRTQIHRTIYIQIANNFLTFVNYDRLISENIYIEHHKRGDWL